jgi:hypothetical protein
MTSKKFLYTTEKEQKEAGYVFLGCDLTIAKSKKYATGYLNKLKNYRRHIEHNNINWIDIYTASRGKYRYHVCADCVEGFSRSGYRYTPDAMQSVKEFLKNVVHKTDCIFSTDRGNAVVDARFLTMEDAEAFAQLLSKLPVFNELPESPSPVPLPSMVQTP